MRESSLPAPVPATLAGGLADVVFETAAQAPDGARLGRQEDGRRRDVTAAEFRAEVTALARGPLAYGCLRGPAGDHVARPVRVDAVRLRAVDDRGAARSRFPLVRPAGGAPVRPPVPPWWGPAWSGTAARGAGTTQA